MTICRSWSTTCSSPCTPPKASASLLPRSGFSKRITVIDLSFKKKPEDKIVLVNPEIIVREGKQFEEEGCLSLPDIREKVSRAAKVIVRAQDVAGQLV